MQLFPQGKKRNYLQLISRYLIDNPITAAKTTPQT